MVCIIIGHDGSSQNLVPRYKGPLDAIIKIYTSEGIRGLTKGIFVSLFSNAIASAIFFTMYFIFESLVMRMQRIN